MSSHFDEKSGTIACNTPWGSWFQTVEEIVLEIDCEAGTRGAQVKVDIKSKKLSCVVRGKQVFEGELFDRIVVDESTWSLEDRKLIRVQLTKALKDKEDCWKSLFCAGDGSGDPYAPDPITFDEMQKKQTLENYQLKHPGFDFSNAELTGTYGSQQQ